VLLNIFAYLIQIIRVPIPNTNTARFARFFLPFLCATGPVGTLLADHGRGLDLRDLGLIPQRGIRVELGFNGGKVES